MFSKKNIEAINKLSEKCVKTSYIDPALYTKFEVKRGLRDISGKGVLAGLTEIGEVHSYILDEGEMVPCEGRLVYRGIDINDLVDGFIREDRYGFEETTYLLLFGTLPNKKEQSEFNEILVENRNLPDEFVRDMIMRLPSKDMMNVISRSVLMMYSYDDNADSNAIPNVLAQCLKLISVFPLLAVYGYQAHVHYHLKQSLVIHTPSSELSTAENILYMLREDSKYTHLEAKLLDLALVLHAEHGGGNNSSFTTRVVSSSATDTYSVIAAALGSLKGPRHGGANIKVVQMFDDMKEKVSDWNDDACVSEYLTNVVNKKAFDNSGLIYGMGHAVYSISDPRAVIFKKYVEELAKSKGLYDEFLLFAAVERLAPVVIAKERKIYKGVSANVDFYSGFVYKMLNIPPELFTPLFAISRIVGWSAHRIEELVGNGKIIRPAYKSVSQKQDYKDLDARD